VAHLELRSGDEPVAFPLDFDRTVIGENPGEARPGAEEARFAFTGGGLSDEHAEIRRTPQGFKVIDLESRHGTRVNGRYVNQQVLAEGDEIVLGKVTLVFRAGDALPGPIAAAPPKAVRRGGSPSKKATPRRAAPASRAPGGRAAPARADRSAARTAKAAPTGDRKRRAQRRVADEEEFEDEYEERLDRRAAQAAERKRKQTLTIATIVIPVVALLMFLLWQGLKSEGSINERVRRRMLAQQDALQWSAMLETAKEALPDNGDHDYLAVLELKKEALKQSAHSQDLAQLDAANKGWRAVQVWRQSNWDEDDEFVARIDAYLAEFGALGGASVQEARKNRFKITGTSGGGAPKNAAQAWQRLESELALVHETGQYGGALHRLEEFWREHGAANIALRPKKEAMKKELLEGAKKYFARRLYSARRNASQGAKGKAARILAQAAETIGLPEYRQRAADEADKLGDL